MGQYYKCVNLTKKQKVEPHDFENGAKLMEHSYIGNKFMNVIENLLSPNGSWYKNSIVHAGDYMENAIFIEDTKPYVEGEDLFSEEVTGRNLYEVASEYIYSKRTNVEKLQEPRFLVNWDKREFVNVSNIIPDDYWVDKEGIEHPLRIHPLSLLTSSGNGQGGGDYHPHEDDEHYVGSWAGHTISVEFEQPTDMTEINPNFREDRE